MLYEGENMFSLSPEKANKLAKLLIFLAVPIFILSLFFTYRMYSFLSHAQTAKGTIVRLIESHGENGVSFKPVFTFITKDGTKYKITSSISSSPPIAEVGEEIEVLYLPNSPKDAIIDYWFSKWGLPIVLIIVTISQILAGIFIKWFYKE